MTSRASQPRGKPGYIVGHSESEAKAARQAFYNSMKVMTADIAAQVSSNGHAKPEAAQQNGAPTAALDGNTPDFRKTRSLRPLLGLRSFIFQYKAKLVLAGVSLVLAATSTLALPIAVRFVIDHGFSGTIRAISTRLSCRCLPSCW